MDLLNYDHASDTNPLQRINDLLRRLEALERAALTGDLYNNTTYHIAAKDASRRAHETAQYTCNGVDDQDQINAAITEAATYGGGKIVLSEGTFVVSDPITITGDHIHLRGQGPDATVIQTAGTFPVSGFAVEFSGVGVTLFDISARNFTIDGGSVANLDGGLLVEGVVTSVFADITVTNFTNGDAFRIQYSSNRATFDNDLLRPRVSNCYRGVVLLGTSVTYFCNRNNVVSGRLVGPGTGVAGSVGILIGNGSNLVTNTNAIHWTDIQSYETGIDVHGDNNRVGGFTESNGLGINIRSTASDTVLDMVDHADALTDNGTGTFGWSDQKRWYPHTESLWLPAAAFDPRVGSPSRANAALASIWSLADATQDGVSCSFDKIPDAWHTFDIILYWTNDGAGSGDVRIRLEYNDVPDGTGLGGGITTVDGTYTAPAQNILEITTLASGVTNAIDALWLVGASRLGAHADDNLGNAMGVVGLRLVRVT